MPVEKSGRICSAVKELLFAGVTLIGSSEPIYDDSIPLPENEERDATRIIHYLPTGSQLNVSMPNI
jgi:hypothetical protein